MTPMEAWHIISANMLQLYKLRRAMSNGAYRGFEDVETEAEVMCFRALQEMDERQEKK